MVEVVKKVLFVLIVIVVGADGNVRNEGGDNDSMVLVVTMVVVHGTPELHLSLRKWSKYNTYFFQYINRWGNCLCKNKKKS